VNPHPNRDLALVNAAGFLRSLGVGLLGVVLGIYLFRLGLSSLAIGLVVATGLAGSALATIAVSFAADRLGRKNSLLYLSLLSTMGGFAPSAVAADNGVHQYAEWHRHRSFGRLCS